MTEDITLPLALATAGGWFARYGWDLARFSALVYCEAKAAQAAADGVQNWRDRFFVRVIERLEKAPKPGGR